MGPAGSCGGPRVDAELAHEPGEAVGAEPDVEPVLGDLDPLDQQLHDARLLGPEEAPKRSELTQRVAYLRLFSGAILSAPRARCRPRPRTGGKLVTLKIQAT